MVSRGWSIRTFWSVSNNTAASMVLADTDTDTDTDTTNAANDTVAAAASAAATTVAEEALRG